MSLETTEITLAVNGALGRMGSTVLSAAAAEAGITPVGGADNAASSDAVTISGTSVSVPLATSLTELFQIVKPNVVVDFTNGEAAGPVTKFWTGITFPPGTVIDRYAQGQPVHPTMIYESLGNVLIFLILWRLRLKHFRP